MDEVDLYQFENSLRNCDGLPWDLINEAIVENIPDNGSKPTPAEARQQLAEIQEFNGKYKQFRSEVNKAKQEAANKRASREQVEEYLGHDAKEVAKLGLEAALAIVRIVGYRKPNRNQRISKAESVEEEAEIVEEDFWKAIFKECIRVAGTNIKQMVGMLESLTDMDNNFGSLLEFYEGKARDQNEYSNSEYNRRIKALGLVSDEVEELG